MDNIQQGLDGENALAGVSVDEPEAELDSPLYKLAYKYGVNEVHIWRLERDADGTIKTWRLVDANPAALKAWNKTLPDIVGKTTNEIFDVDATSIFMPIVEKVFKEQKPYSWEEDFPATNQIMHMTTIPFGEMFLSIGQNIIRTRQAEEHIKRLEERHRALLDNSPVCHKIVDQDLNLQYMNASGFKMLGLAENDDWYGKQYPFDFFPESSRNRLIDALKKVLQTREVASLEDVACDVEGNEIWLDHHLIPVNDSDGQLSFITVVSADITQRKLSAKNLKRNQELLKKSQEMGRIGTWELDIVKNVLTWTEENYRIFGLPVGTPLSYETFINCVHPDDRDYVDQEWSTKIKSNDYDIEHRLLVGDNVEHRVVAGHKIKWVREKAEVIFNDDGQPIRAIGFTQDITESKQVEEQLLQSQKLESVGTLAGGIAHDFNNLLMGIMNHVDIARDDLGQEHPVCKILNDVYADAERSADLIKGLLAFARRQPANPKVLNINDEISQTINMLSRVIREGIELKWHPSSDVGSVLMDAHQVNQILMNLCLNASDAIVDVGTISISTHSFDLRAGDIRRHDNAVPGKYIHLQVSDTGCGMDEETMLRAFDPFFTTKTFGKGTGLGLATVHGIVTQNNGFIDVHSKAGEGATFDVYLPAASDAAADKPKPDEMSCPLGGGETILLVEDEKSIRKTTSIFLKKMGYDVVEASEPAIALDILENQDDVFDLIITDVVMPGMTGKDMVERFLVKNADVRVLYISGYSADIIAEHGLIPDEVNLLTKPFKREDLATKVREVLDTSQD